MSSSLQQQSNHSRPDLASLELNIVPCDEPPPDYSINAPLVPMAPSQNGRYTRNALLVLESIRIPRGLHSTLLSPEPPYLPVGWAQAFNPEGTPYYFNKSKHLVTDDPIYQPDISNKITRWTEKIEILVKTNELGLPDEYEIFITVAAEDDGCKYYFVDHATRTVFWLEEIDPGRHDLELAQGTTTSGGYHGGSSPEMYNGHLPFFECDVLLFEGGMIIVCSQGQLPRYFEKVMIVYPQHNVNFWLMTSPRWVGFVLQEQYWIHNEYFPHRAVPNNLRRELVDIFRQGRADQLTSDDSTFPYGAEQCKQYLEIIDVDTECNTYMTWIIARLWGTISRHKFSTFYGEDHAKISRMQRRFDKTQTERTCMLKLVSALLFGMPKSCSAELDSLSVDQLTYAVHWRDFATELLNGWRESSCLAVGLALIGSVSAVQQTNPVSQCIGTVSVVFALGGLSSGAMLLQWYAGAEKLSAARVANHLACVQMHGYGYEPIAQAFCLPRALVFWSIIFLTAHVLSAVVDLYGLIARGPAILLALLFVGGLIHLNHVLRDAFENPERQSDAKSFGLVDGARLYLQRLGAILQKALHISQSTNV